MSCISFQLPFHIRIIKRNVLFYIIWDKLFYRMMAETDILFPFYHILQINISAMRFKQDIFLFLRLVFIYRYKYIFTQNLFSNSH